MRSEENPLDLNNLPEDYARDAKLITTTSSHSQHTSSSAVYKKRKSGGKDFNEPSKIYECRFCSLKFFKSQALGGHMNRHRQERESETLSKARQLVFTNHLAYVSTGQPMAAYHEGGNSNGQLPFRPIYSTRLFPPPPPQGAAYSPPRTFHSQFQASAAVSDYFLGHVMSNRSYGGEGKNNYTCIGEPVAQGFCGDDGVRWGRTNY